VKRIYIVIGAEPNPSREGGVAALILIDIKIMSEKS
jgi:hypothetical protein